MARKKPPSSLERKKLRERRARASALAAHSSVKADKKPAWWCKKKKGPTYSHLPSSQQEWLKQEEQGQTTQELTTQKQSTQKREIFLASLLGFALSLYLYVYVYEYWLHRWYLVGPDTLYLRYGFSSVIVAFLMYWLEFGALIILFNNLFLGVGDWLQNKIDFRGFLSQLKWWPLLFIAALALFFGPVLLSCLSRTEATTTGVATYVLGIQTSWHPFEELEEAEYYRKDYRAGRGSNRTYPTYNYDLRFQDGYEIKLTDLDRYCMGTGWEGQNELYSLVSPYFRD